MRIRCAASLALAAAIFCGSSARADPTFTYQGRLSADGLPHTGTVDLVFELYEQANGGSQQGPTLLRSVHVAGGLFQTGLDFGVQAYGADRWLQITVDGQLMLPRQRITGAPFAMAVSKAGDCATLAPDDEMVRVGSTCIDKYEASLWDAAVGGNQLTTQAGIRALCPDDGQDCHGKLFARSVVGVEPARFITWFQAQQALANSGKRLPTNAEWQRAATGTPEHPGSCNTAAGVVHDTGANPDCVSEWGAHDMVGNLWEWVADWMPRSTTCPGWADDGEFSSDDFMCLGGASTVSGPGALVRGGVFGAGTHAGPFAISGSVRPSHSDAITGFRGAR